MSDAARNDPLGTLANEMLSYANQHKLSVFFGAPHTDKNTFEWNKRLGGDWKKFLDVANALGVTVFYFNTETLEQADVDRALEDVDRIAGRERSQLSDGSRQEIEGYRNKVGLTVIVDLAFIRDGIIHLYQSRADWFDEFCRLTEERESPQRFEEDAEPDPAVVKEWGEKLARHPEYRLCKSEAAQELLLEEIAGEAFETLPIHDILGRAVTVYELKVWPEQKKILRVRVRELRESGLNQNQIAEELQISRDKVSAFLVPERITKSDR